MIYHHLPEQNRSNPTEGFSAVDLALPTDAANVAEIVLTARYPARGFAINTASEMIVRIIEGETELICEDEHITLPEGATVLVQTHKKYCWIPNGSVRLYVVSAPPWTAEQQLTVDE